MEKPSPFQNSPPSQQRKEGDERVESEGTGGDQRLLVRCPKEASSSGEGSIWEGDLEKLGFDLEQLRQLGEAGHGGAGKEHCLGSLRPRFWVHLGRTHWVTL